MELPVIVCMRSITVSPFSSWAPLHSEHSIWKHGGHSKETISRAWIGWRERRRKRRSGDRAFEEAEDAVQAKIQGWLQKRFSSHHFVSQRRIIRILHTVQDLLYDSTQWPVWYQVSHRKQVTQGVQWVCVVEDSEYCYLLFKAWWRWRESPTGTQNNTGRGNDLPFYCRVKPSIGHCRQAIK